MFACLSIFVSIPRLSGIKTTCGAGRARTATAGRQDLLSVKLKSCNMHRLWNNVKLAGLQRHVVYETGRHFPPTLLPITTNLNVRCGRFLAVNSMSWSSHMAKFAIVLVVLGFFAWF